VERIAWQRRTMELQEQLNKLPSTAGVYLSEEIERRERRRRPVERKLGAAYQHLEDYTSVIEIDLTQLIGPGFLVDFRSAGERVIREIGRHDGTVKLIHVGMDPFGFGIDVRIDGVQIPVESDGIHMRAFFSQSYAYYPLLEVQAVYYRAMSAEGTKLLQQMT